MYAGMPCTRHRVFLATLIAAAKYLNDSSPKNKHWARHAILFDTAEINLMEQQLLLLLNFDLRFDEKQAIEAFSPFMPQRTSAQQDKQTRKKALDLLKASRSQGHADVQLPLTPPHDAVPPSAALTEPSTAHLHAGSTSQATLHKRSPTSHGSSPMELAASSATLESETSMGALTEDNGSSESEPEEFEDCLGSSVLISDSSRCISGATTRGKARTSIASLNRTTSRPMQSRSSSASAQLVHRRSYLTETRLPLPSSLSMANLPRIRDSVSTGFLSRMFGNSAKERIERVFDVKRRDEDTVLIASDSSRGIRNVPQILRPGQYDTGLDVVDL